ncbi:hypothetical protein AOQ84DRAFT_375423 [Glonium stellatum]|uniref:Uncharacterized protein n=1 Tax=Glonium stellatum TaxID=574774 RepID=A0A8E2F3Z9_9PEZI|nr:hypothetical protein AOQ84DRAFT_375423 [Glonium stellatum]
MLTNNRQNFQEATILLRQHPQGLHDADCCGRTGTGRSIVELIYNSENENTYFRDFKIVQNVCRNCYNEPSRFLNNHNAKELRTYNDYCVPVQYGSTFYTFRAISSRCIHCGELWSKDCNINMKFRLLLDTSYDLEAPGLTQQRKEWSCKPFLVEAEELHQDGNQNAVKSRGAYQDNNRKGPPTFSSLLNEYPFGKIPPPRKTSVEAVVEAGRISSFRLVSKTCASCGSNPWRVYLPSGQYRNQMYNNWKFAVIQGTSCYEFRTVNNRCVKCSHCWVESLSDDRGRKYVLVLMAKYDIHQHPIKSAAWTVEPLRVSRMQAQASPSRLQKHTSPTVYQGHLKDETHDYKTSMTRTSMDSLMVHGSRERGWFSRLRHFSPSSSREKSNMV